MSNASGDYDVVLYLYDLSQGMARQLSPALLGKQIDGIWHTGIIVYGYEYYYGGGIQVAKPGATMAGNPTQIIPLGRTSKKQSEFHAFLRAESHKFTPETYSLLSNNCNNFTSECSKFLLAGTDIPSFITGLPEEALSTPMGQMFRPMIQSMEQQMKSSFSQGGGGGAPGIPWQEPGMPTDHASLYLPRETCEHPPAPAGSPTAAAASAGAGAGASEGKQDNGAAALAAAFMAAAMAATSSPAAAAAASGVAGGGAGVVAGGLRVPASAGVAQAESHADLKLKLAGRGHAAVTPQAAVYPTPADKLPLYVLMTKAGSKRPSVVLDEVKALTEAEEAGLRWLCALVRDGKADFAKLGDVANGFPAAAALARIVTHADPSYLAGPLGLLRSLTCSKPVVEAFFGPAGPPASAALVTRLQELAYGEGNAASAAASAGAPAAVEAKSAVPAVGAAGGTAPGLQYLALTVLLNVFAVPAAAGNLAVAADTVAIAANSALASKDYTVRAAAGLLLFNIVHARKASASEDDILSDGLLASLTDLASAVGKEATPKAARAELQALCEMVYASPATAMMVGDAGIDLAGIVARFGKWRPENPAAASAKSDVDAAKHAVEFAEDLAAMLALTDRLSNE